MGESEGASQQKRRSAHAMLQEKAQTQSQRDVDDAKTKVSTSLKQTLMETPVSEAQTANKYRRELLSSFKG